MWSPHPSEHNTFSHVTWWHALAIQPTHQPTNSQKITNWPIDRLGQAHNPTRPMRTPATSPPTEKHNMNSGRAKPLWGQHKIRPNSRSKSQPSYLAHSVCFDLICFNCSLNCLTVSLIRHLSLVVCSVGFLSTHVFGLRAFAWLSPGEFCSRLLGCLMACVHLAGLLGRAALGFCTSCKLFFFFAWLSLTCLSDGLFGHTLLARGLIGRSIGWSAGRSID